MALIARLKGRPEDVHHCRSRGGSSTMKRRYFWWGLYGTLAVLSFCAIWIVTQIAFSYDGKCGGLLPFLASPRPCSFWEYVSESVRLTVLILWEAYWPVVLALLLVPASVGYLLDRQAQKRTT